MQDSIIFIDFEGSKSTSVVEFGIVITEGLEISSAHTALCASTKKLDWQDTKQHGISDKDLKKKPAFTEYWDDFATLREDSIFAAHNASVEHNFLKWTWPHPRPSINPLAPDQKQQDWGPWIDSLQLYKQYYPQLENHQLEELITTFQLQEELDELADEFCPENRTTYHCALYDALACFLLTKNWANAVKSGQATALDLLQESQSASEKQSNRQQEFSFE